MQKFVLTIFEESEQQKRLEYFQRAVAHLVKSFSSTLTPAQTIQVYLSAGRSYETFGAWDQALESYRQVVRLCNSQPQYRSEKSEALRWIGHILLMRSQWQDARESYQESVNLSHATGDQEGEAYAYNGIACLCFEQGELAEASSHWEKSLELAEQLDATKLIAQVYNNLGALANVQGHWEKALTNYGESLPRFEKIGERRGLAETYHNMAMTYADAGRWPEAGAHYERSYQVAKEIGDVRLEATVKLNRVKLYIAIGDTTLAEALCHQALQTYLHLEDHLGEAEVYKCLGMLDAERRAWAPAQSYFEKSLQITRKYRSPLCEAETHFEYGRMLRIKGITKAATTQFELALDLFTELEAEKEIQKVKQELDELSE
ncbi:MAG: tetratricopeptide repeat protein [bacterium]